MQIGDANWATRRNKFSSPKKSFDVMGHSGFDGLLRRLVDCRGRVCYQAWKADGDAVARLRSSENPPSRRSVLKSKARILLMAIAVVGSGAWIVSSLSEADEVEPALPQRGSANICHRPEPAGWVFGRLVGIQQSVLEPSAEQPGLFQGIHARQESENRP
jgi:hypothetical protein